MSMTRERRGRRWGRLAGAIIFGLLVLGVVLLVLLAWLALGVLGWLGIDTATLQEWVGELIRTTVESVLTGGG